MDHTLVPPRPFQPSLGQVSWPTSPGQGIVWKVQSFLPVRASYARESPGTAAQHLVLGMEVRLARAVHVGPDQDDIFVDRRDLGERHVHGHFAAVAKFGVELARHRIESHKLVEAREDDSRRVVGVARPVGNAALRDETRLQS